MVSFFLPRGGTHMRFVMCLVVFYAALLPAQQLKVSAETDDPLVVVQDGRYGYIDRQGKVVIRPQFIWGSAFYKGFATVYVCGRSLSMDPSGRILPLRYAAEGELEPRRKGNKFGFVDAAGRFSIPPDFDDALPFSDGLAAVAVGDKWGFIDTAGHIVIQPKFEDAFYFREGVGTVALDGGYALIDKRGSAIATGLKWVENVSEGRVPVKRGGMTGYLDLQGKTVVPFAYENGFEFEEGLAQVSTGNKWGYINRGGHVVIPIEFDYAGAFGKGLAPARRGQDSGFINHSGEFVFHLAFDYAPGLIYGDPSRFWTKDRRFGYVNSSGKVIWGPVEGSPDHAPLIGWSEKAKTQSCEGIPQSLKDEIAKIPPDNE